ncbi:MAG: transporter [Calothrix sp. MO_167.B12]|nr:transporter [Calothrix sp. MO_167.B12]
MNCDRYSLVILGIICSIPITANIAYSQEAYKTPHNHKNNIKINSELNINRQAEVLNFLAIGKFDKNAIATENNPNYKQPQKNVKKDKISTSAVDIQEQSYLSTQLGLFDVPKLNPSEMSFELATKPVVGKPEQNIFPNSRNFPSINNFIIADKNHSSKPGKWSSARPDGHAPIGVMGEHTHGKGEFMFSYRYMLMSMNGNRDGTDKLSDSEVLQQFMVTPTKMTMEMHMFGAMYAPSDNLTLMAMVPYVVKDMDHITRSGVRFTTNSEGFGDIKTSALYKIFDDNNQRIHLNLGASFPTGSINERDDTPAGNNQILPYPMQIGSGTFDLLPGITYLGQSKQNSWGAQAMGTLRLGENSNGYRLGNQFLLTGWVARNWTEWLGTSLRLTGRTWGNIDGEDDRLNPMMIPTADPDRRGGTQLDIGFGVNLYAPKGDLKGSRLAVEFELPLYRSLDGPQLETDWQLTLGLQAAF